MQAPTRPERAEVVTFDGQGGPVGTGPVPEAARRHQRGGA
jgi:hypothetical protein